MERVARTVHGRDEVCSDYVITSTGISTRPSLVIVAVGLMQFGNSGLNIILLNDIVLRSQ